MNNSFKRIIGAAAIVAALLCLVSCGAVGGSLGKKDAVTVRINNKCDGVYGIEYRCYVDGEITATGGAINADGSKLSKRQPTVFEFIKSDLGGSDDVTEFSVELSPVDKDGTAIDGSVNTLTLSAEYGKVYNATLSGDAESGYLITLGD